MFISLTGGKVDAWLMKHLFGPMCEFLVKMSGKTNFFWAQVAYILGMVLIIASLIPSSGVLVNVLATLIWGYDTVTLLSYTKTFKRRIDKCVFTGVIPNRTPLIRLRLLLFFLALLSVVFFVFAGGFAYLALIGILLQAAGGFFATHAYPPGQGALRIIKNRLRQLLVRPAIIPLPVGA